MFMLYRKQPTILSHCNLTTQTRREPKLVQNFQEVLLLHQIKFNLGNIFFQCAESN